MPKVTLTISPAENKPKHYLVVVSGEGFFGSAGAKVGARIRGDDEWFDDKLFGIVDPFARVDSDGDFTLSQTVPGSTLNEDWGKDEIYALVNIERLSRTFKSNKVTGSF